MKTFSKHLVLLSIVAIFGYSISGCEDCNDCGITTSQPYFTVSFFNVDSLDKLDSTIDTLNNYRLFIGYSIDSTNDLIDAIKVGIDTADSNNIIDSLNTILDAYEVSTDTLIDIEESLEEEIIYFDDIADIIETGKNNVIAYAIVEGNPLEINFNHEEDSATSFRFPLSMNNDTSIFIVDIAGNSDTLSVTYQRETIQRDRKIIVVIDSLQFFDTPYDSISPDTFAVDKVSNDVTVNIYF